MIKIILALSIVASLVLVLAPAAMIADGQRVGSPNRTFSPPEELYVVISAVNVTPTVAHFNITADAIRTADGRAMVMNFTKPMAGQYFYGNDTAIIAIDRPPMGKPPRDRPPMDNRTAYSRPYQGPGRRMMGGPPGGGDRRPVMGDYSNTTLNIAGTSAVVAMKNLTRLSDNRTLQFTDIAVYLPNGSLTTYKLGTPVTISHYNRTTTIKGSPELRSIMQGFMASSDRFPANAQPVMLVDIDAKM